MNQISVNSKELLRAVKKSGQVIKRNPSKSILKNILFKVSENIEVIGSDSSSQIVTRLTCVDKNNLSACLDYNTLSSILTGLPNTSIELHFEKKNLLK